MFSSLIFYVNYFMKTFSCNQNSICLNSIQHYSAININTSLGSIHRLKLFDSKTEIDFNAINSDTLILPTLIRIFRFRLQFINILQFIGVTIQSCRKDIRTQVRYRNCVLNKEFISSKHYRIREQREKDENVELTVIIHRSILYSWSHCSYCNCSKKGWTRKAQANVAFGKRSPWKIAWSSKNRWRSENDAKVERIYETEMISIRSNFQYMKICKLKTIKFDWFKWKWRYLFCAFSLQIANLVGGYE